MLSRERDSASASSEPGEPRESFAGRFSYKRLIGLFLQLPIVVFILLEMLSLAYIWQTYVVHGRIFEMELDEHQQGQLLQSMQNYLLSIFAFIGIWCQGLYSISYGLLGLLGWALAFLTFGDDSTEMAFDALCHLYATRTNGEAVEPFAFSRGNKLYETLLVKVVVQTAYMGFVFLSTKAIRLALGVYPAIWWRRPRGSFTFSAPTARALPNRSGDAARPFRLTLQSSRPTSEASSPSAGRRSGRTRRSRSWANSWMNISSR